MNEIFNFHGQEVRTLTIDNEPWFVGKDVADILGYSKARNAIALHVDEDDALKQGLTDNLGRVQETIIINESTTYREAKIACEKLFRQVSHEIELRAMESKTV